jgi:quercetin dioxygenase-like cupin family protein
MRRTVRVYDRGMESPGRGGPVWGTASEELNATLLAWPPGGGPSEHVNAERDVALVVVEGSLELEVDGERRTLGPGEATIVPRGSRRLLRAGPDGVRYATVHRKRGGLSIGTLSRRG